MSGLTFPSLSLSSGPAVPQDAVLPIVVDFLDHFAEALQVVVNCARKTEITRWGYLFQFVGKPRDLFEVSFALSHRDNDTFLTSYVIRNAWLQISSK
jgi:hypothetical protein